MKQQIEGRLDEDVRLRANASFLYTSALNRYLFSHLIELFLSQCYEKAKAPIYKHDALRSAAVVSEIRVTD